MSNLCIHLTDDVLIEKNQKISSDDSKREAKGERVCNKCS